MPVARRIERLIRQTELRQVAGEIRGAILPFENCVPVGVNPSVWACAVGETYTALLNLCFAWDPPPSIEELYRLRTDLRATLRDPVDIQSLEWIRNRSRKWAQPVGMQSRLADHHSSMFSAGGSDASISINRRRRIPHAPRAISTTWPAQIKPRQVGPPPCGELPSGPDRPADSRSG